MEGNLVNVLLTTLPGLKLPKTVNLPPMECTRKIQDLISDIVSLFQVSQELSITTNSNRKLSAHSQSPLSSLLPYGNETFIPLRVTVPVLGGKGGFGSQLRAAGGRMSSKRKKNQGDSNGSSRNLDGRRLRTVTEAKSLAQYLAVKPEMEKKEKEARRKRWEQVVNIAEQREQEVKNVSKGRVDGKWVEEKEEAAERTRGAVLAAMQSGHYKDTSLALTDEEMSSGTDLSGDIAEGYNADADTRPDGSAPLKDKAHAPIFQGFDDGDDDFMSDSDEDV